MKIPNWVKNYENYLMLDDESKMANTSRFVKSDPSTWLYGQLT